MEAVLAAYGSAEGKSDVAVDPRGLASASTEMSKDLVILGS